MLTTTSRNLKSRAKKTQPVIGIVLGEGFDDWLDELGLSLNIFANEMMGSWVFNYIQALEAVGVHSVLFCVSTKIQSYMRLKHIPTGATIVALPASRIYRLVKRWLPKHPDHSRDHAKPELIGDLVEHAPKAIHFILSYFSTPIMTLFLEVRREGCQSLFVQEYESSRFNLCVMMGKLMRVPVFGTFTGALIERARIDPLRSVALRMCSGLAVCAKSEAERVIANYALPDSKLALIYYPLDSSVWHPEEKQKARTSLGIPPNAKVAIYHGAINIRIKGLDVLADAWDRICCARPGHDLRLFLIGAGADTLALSKLIGRLRGVEWLNEWIHDRDLLRRYLSSADVYIFPSRDDAFGIAVLEAMACGLPVVAANARGIPDIFPDGECSGGLVVPKGDAQAMARAIGMVLDTPELAYEFAQRARQRIADAFSMEAIGEQLRELLVNGRQQ